jgi:hypothetical protein
MGVANQDPNLTVALNSKQKELVDKCSKPIMTKKAPKKKKEDSRSEASATPRRLLRNLRCRTHGTYGGEGKGSGKSQI